MTYRYDHRFTGWEPEDAPTAAPRPSAYRGRRHESRRVVRREIIGRLVRRDYDDTPDWHPDTSQDIPF